ncbi:uncharacterized protein LY89DRAFT_768261 [Mollisia scopiformis]|uniref:Uncharacterized protein n=1 Tax=Mollisia scopiformis TaxID=149040 RepID=A0A194XP17_MOLSC|nr:uncharacterized protein LY89DRAFT_768261 [Mollisia scopiformis]KUJ21990.1 hypothetical protein LY89DRAFT_768261 [Mollisia scopiformis]
MLLSYIQSTASTRTSTSKCGPPGPIPSSALPLRRFNSSSNTTKPPSPPKEPIQSPPSRDSTPSPIPSTKVETSQEQPFCCPSLDLPIYSPTSHALTLFLRALTIRRQHITTITSSSSSTLLFSPLFPLNTLPFPHQTQQQLEIIEFETISSDRTFDRKFQHRYFIIVPGRDISDVEMDLGGNFREVSISWVEEERRKGDDGGGWGFVGRDEVVRDRVGWRCEDCGVGYWVRLIGVGE